MSHGRAIVSFVNLFNVFDKFSYVCNRVHHSGHHDDGKACVAHGGSMAARLLIVDILEGVNTG